MSECQTCEEHRVERGAVLAPYYEDAGHEARFYAAFHEMHQQVDTHWSQWP